MKEEEIEKIINDEIDALFELFDKNPDPILMLLRYHLLIENMLERMIIGKIDNGYKVVENGNLTFYQKVIFVDAFSELNDSIIQSIKKLNSVRNECAHDKDKKITKADIEKIGKPLGKKFTKIKQKYNSDKNQFAERVFAHIFSEILKKLIKLES